MKMLPPEYQSVLDAIRSTARKDACSVSCLDSRFRDVAERLAALGLVRIVAGVYEVCS